jgi:hypothetical protein
MAGLGTRDRVATLLAVLATLSVLATTAVAVATYSRRDGAVAPDAASGSPSGSSAGSPGAAVQGLDGSQIVHGGGARFGVPSSADGWTVQPRDTVLYYLDRRGDPSVGVKGAAVYRAGYCRGRADSNRAFVGFAGSVAGGSVRTVNTDLARRWVRAIALDDDLATSGPHTSLRTEDVTLADGATAVRSTSRITVARRGPCEAPAVDLAMVSLDTGRRVASLVLVRDAGVPGVLPDHAADAILATLHRAGD